MRLVVATIAEITGIHRKSNVGGGTDWRVVRCVPLGVLYGGELNASDNHENWNGHRVPVNSR